MRMTLHWFVIGLLAFVQLAKAENGPPTEQIIGGYPANRGQFSWQAMLKKDGNIYCGGSLISPQWILTAAHCITDGNYTILLGALTTDDFEAGAVEMSIDSTKIFKHENFSGSNLRNDIALIKLPLALSFPPKPDKNATIAVIAVAKPSDKKKTYVGANATMSGWGQTDAGGEPATSPFLKWTFNPVVNISECKSKFDSLEMSGLVYDGNICTDTASESGACHGDSGGPLVALGADKKFILIGLTSFGFPKYCLTGYSVFTKVSYFADWIAKTMKK